MLISTVCKTHGLSRIRGPILFLPFSPPTPVLRTAFTTLQSTRRVDSRGCSTRASGGGTPIDHRTDFLIFTSEPRRKEISRPTLRSPFRGSIPRIRSLIRFSLCCERAGPSLVDHGVCVKLVAVSRRHQAVILYTNIIKFYHYNIGSFFLVKFMWHVYTHCHGK